MDRPSHNDEQDKIQALLARFDEEDQQAPAMSRRKWQENPWLRYTITPWGAGVIFDLVEAIKYRLDRVLDWDPQQVDIPAPSTHTPEQDGQTPRETLRNSLKNKTKPK